MSNEQIPLHHVFRHGAMDQRGGAASAPWTAQLAQPFACAYVDDFASADASDRSSFRLIEHVTNMALSHKKGDIGSNLAMTTLIIFKGGWPSTWVLCFALWFFASRWNAPRSKFTRVSAAISGTGGSHIQMLVSFPTAAHCDAWADGMLFFARGTWPWGRDLWYQHDQQGS